MIWNKLNKVSAHISKETLFIGVSIDMPAFLAYILTSELRVGSFYWATENTLLKCVLQLKRARHPEKEKRTVHTS